MSDELRDKEQSYADDAQLDAEGDFVESWREAIDDYRRQFPQDKRTDYQLAAMFEKDHRDYLNDLRDMGC